MHRISLSWCLAWWFITLSARALTANIMLFVCFVVFSCWYKLYHSEQQPFRGIEHQCALLFIFTLPLSWFAPTNLWESQLFIHGSYASQPVTVLCMWVFGILRSASRSAYALWLSLTLSTTSSLFWHELFFSVALLFYFMRSIVPHVLAWTFNICLPWLPSMTCGRCTSTVDTMCHHMCPQIHHCYHVTTLRLLMPRNYTTFIDAMATTDDT